jgi:ubiquinone/menaquinone biosynthesis C-methylase UbiE
MTENRESKSKKSYKGMAMEGSIARWYAKNTKGNIDQYKNWAKKVAENINEGNTVLEVAPGPGYLSIELAKLGNYKITGMDISETFVEIAQTNAEKAGVTAKFVHGDASNMSFDDETFDFIVCTSAFKNFTKPIMALNEMYRVLKPGGKALIIDLRSDASRESINDHVENMGLNWINKQFTKLSFRIMLLRNAYTKEEIQDLLLNTKFTKWRISLDPMGFEMHLEK